MEYIIGAAAVIAVIFAGAYIMQKKADKKLQERIKNSFGKIPELEYTHEKYESIGFYFRTMAERDPEDTKHCVIDNITWNDLDMDNVFLTACATQSSIGEEYLYYMLRTPTLDNDVLRKREELTGFFAKDPDTRLKLQTELAKAGKIKGVSVYEYLNRLDNLENESNVKHFACIALLAAAIGTIFVYPPVGIMATLGVFFYNVMSYFKRKGEIENYYAVVAYILRTLDLTDRICAINNEVLTPYTSVLKEELKKFRNVTRGAALIVSKKSNGDILEVALDYLRMATHIDLIRFNVMLGKLKDKKDEFDKIYEIIGLIDSTIAVASFRELMGTWCIPELSAAKDNIGIDTENIYHPMISEPVKNNFKENGNVLLTGSNASGKSTFIKTVAINSILAQSINTCMADRYRASFFKCMTSMALTDNLSGGESYYIVEIKSLKRICDSLNTQVPLLIFVDEVLRGTNTLERIAASSRILSYMGAKNCMLFAATHDIELTYILEKSFKMYHFEEKVEDDGVFFDYKLRDGRAVTRNAILLLKMMGFEESITDAAEKAADEFTDSGEWKPLEA
ncbi:MAG: hypothetical protein J6X68_04260 [Lachnospiraceae bacterium]|nr:hypothetical protein [Lachnospiraceae bacterium]